MPRELGPPEPVDGSGADPAEVNAFLARYADGPLADALRREWLKALGASGAWDAFRAEYPKVVGEDTELTCYAYQARIAQGDAEALVEARSLFLAGRGSVVGVLRAGAGLECP